ncbi:hypothetical protein FLLO111716_14635 [Flavobacterium longum]
MQYKEDDIKKAAEYRLRGIATQLYNQGKPVYLISGMDSSSYAHKQNENLEDDNGIIYISIGECLISQSESKAKEIFNEQTKMLIEKK